VLGMVGEDEKEALSLESRSVHRVYEVIASHFSETRYKPWPLVEKFLKDLPPGSVGLDVGCGNGKYLGINPEIFIIGSDRSSKLTEIVRDRNFEVNVSDCIDIPALNGRLDFAISIAVIHHLSSDVRRIAGIKALLDALRPNGTALIYVWALEQKNSRRGWDESSDQDVMVPWKTRQGSEEVTYQRYYHLFKKGELEDYVLKAGGKVLDAGYEKDNWWAIVTHATSMS